MSMMSVLESVHRPQTRRDWTWGFLYAALGCLLLLSAVPPVLGLARTSLGAMGISPATSFGQNLRV